MYLQNNFAKTFEQKLSIFLQQKLLKKVNIYMVFLLIFFAIKGEIITQQNGAYIKFKY